MVKHIKEKYCPNCGSLQEMVRGIVRVDIHLENIKCGEINAKAWICTKCGKGALCSINLLDHTEGVDCEME